MNGKWNGDPDARRLYVRQDLDTGTSENQGWHGISYWSAEA